MWARFICLALGTDGWPRSTSSWVASLEEAITRTLLSSSYTYWILRWPGAPMWEDDANWLIQCLSRAVLKWPGGVPHEHKLFLTSRKKIQAEFFLHFCSLLPAGVWCSVENLIFGTSTIWIANSCLSIGTNNLPSLIFGLKRAIGKKWMDLFSLWVWVIFHYAHKTHWKLYPPINGRKLVLILGYSY